ncbi:MAG: methyltransferase domain-containing protein [Myxococcaceae bacterium]|jgi:ubiquinone/menaquinone biosynthesis C-methylase UbiE|nr:methyltransferase domain-containing protein [Myxococcaceae bacterium]MCA3011179.1 methyltransferase domain-containing protein [Myxococcaceae bacterium]
MDERLHKHGRFFDVWSRFYRSNPFGQELRRIQRLAIERLRLVPGQVVLDLGCGPGDGAARIAELGAIAIGLDYSAGMLDSARREPRLTNRLLRGDAGRLPFRDGAFDKLVCTNSFHHYPDHFKALCEMRRVLKPGGLLVLVDPRRDHLFGWGAIDLVENAVFGLEEVRIFSVTQWCQLLGEAGFSDYRVDRGRIWSPVEWAEAFIEARA